MKGNRQIGLDGRVFISDCLNDGIFFVYSIILSGFLGAAGDIMKLLGQSSRGMDSLTNTLVICDLIGSLGMVIVAYYVYFMHCGENIPKLGTKPLIWLEYLRLSYYGILAYEVLYRLASDLQRGSDVPAAIPIFYFFYLAWLICCICAAMFILTVLHQNVLRRSYAQSFKWLSLAGLGTNIILPLVYFITRIWVRGWGDGFYSAGLCDFVKFALAPVFYGAIWFLFMSAIDQVERVFNEVDNAIRDRRYRIEFDEEEGRSKKKSASKKKSGTKKKKSEAKKEVKPVVQNVPKPEPIPQPEPETPPVDEFRFEEIQVEVPSDVLTEPIAEEPSPEEENANEVVIGDITLEEALQPPVVPAESEEPVAAEEPAESDSEEADDSGDDEKGAKKVKPKKKHRITEIEEESTVVKASVRSADEIAAEITESDDSGDEDSDE